MGEAVSSVKVDLVDKGLDNDVYIGSVLVVGDKVGPCGAYALMVCSMLARVPKVRALETYEFEPHVHSREQLHHWRTCRGGVEGLETPSTQAGAWK